jgi:hypothetical protein
MAEGIETQRHRDTEESQNCWKARIDGKQGLVERVVEEIVGDGRVGDGRVGDEIVGDDSLLYSVPLCLRVSKKVLVL